MTVTDDPDLNSDFALAGDIISTGDHRVSDEGSLGELEVGRSTAVMNGGIIASIPALLRRMRVDPPGDPSVSIFAIFTGDSAAAGLATGETSLQNEKAWRGSACSRRLGTYGLPNFLGEARGDASCMTTMSGGTANGGGGTEPSIRTVCTSLSR